MFDLMDKITSLAKRRGFVFGSSEIYGGIGGCWDYGPVGVLLKNNIKNIWWKSMVQEREDIIGLDSSIITNPKVWEASGHVESFTDPLVDCKSCKKRFRADKLVEGLTRKEEGVTTTADIKKLTKALQKIKCPDCGGELTPPRRFNLLVNAYLGVLEDRKSQVYLRGETCQGIFVDFNLALLTARQKIPFGIAQIGKAFRNEITPGNFIFRAREFEQMEMEYFVNPQEAKRYFHYWKQERLKWYLTLGIKRKNIRLRQHKVGERAHYAKDAWDIEYKTPFGGFEELEGIHNRGDWDLSRHSQYSGKDLSYFDDEEKKKYIPWVIETSAGVDRSFLVFLFDAYSEDEVPDEKGKPQRRIVLRIHKNLAPFKVAVLPLLKDQKLVSKAKDIAASLRKHWMTDYDESQSIGRRYRRQDEIGTPFCVTVDFDTLSDNSVTIRDRDSTKQERVKIKDLSLVLGEKISG